MTAPNTDGLELTLDQLKGLISEEHAKAAEQLHEKIKDEVKAEVREELAQSATARVESKVDRLLASASEDGPGAGPSEKRGALFGRVMRAIASAKGRIDVAAAVARKWGDEKVVEIMEKALSSGDGTAGGFLVEDAVADEVIEVLRARSVVRSLNPRTVPLDSGTLRMPKHTSGSSGSWIGENQNATATQPAFGQVVLSAKKYASLVPISNDLLRRASFMADTLVRDDLVGDIRTATDSAFIRGSGTGGEPKGLKNWAGNALDANGTVNLGNVTADLGTMLQTLLDNDVQFEMGRLGWIMEPRTWRYLITVRETSTGTLAFKPEMDGGTLFGIPFRVTSQIPRNLDASGTSGDDETELYLANFDDVVIGEATGILIDVSDSAAYHDGSNVVAAYSLDQTVIRAIVEVDLAVRHAESVVLLEEVTWGV